MTFFITILVLSLWTIYRLNFPQHLLFDELLIKPLMWLTPVLLAVKFDLTHLGFVKKNIIRNIILGVLVGLILSLERVFIKHLSFQFSFVIIISALFTAVVEEIFFRGYLLNNWLKYFKNPIIAMILNGLFFSATHIPIAIFIFHYYGYNLFSYLLLNFISGFVDIFLFTSTKSIYTSISNHFIWNLFSGLFK